LFVANKICSASHSFQKDKQKKKRCAASFDSLKLSCLLLALDCFQLSASLNEKEEKKLLVLVWFMLAKALFSSQKILQNFSDSPLHRIFRHMHEVLNIDKNKN